MSERVGVKAPVISPESLKIDLSINRWKVKNISALHLNFMMLVVSSVPRGSDHQAEADCSGLQSELLTGQSLQVGPEEEPLQHGHKHAPSKRSSSVLPAALPGVGRAQR